MRISRVNSRTRGGVVSRLLPTIFHAAHARRRSANLFVRMYDMRKREVEVSGACLLPPMYMYMRVYASRLIANGCDAALAAGSARLRSPRGFAFRVPGCCMCTAAAQETRRDLARFRVASRRPDFEKGRGETIIIGTSRFFAATPLSHRRQLIENEITSNLNLMFTCIKFYTNSYKIL